MNTEVIHSQTLETHKYMSKHGLIIQLKWYQTLFWTCQVPSIQTCTCLYLVPSSELRAHTAVQYQVPCTCTHTNTFVSSFVLPAHNATRCNTMVQNWLNCQVNMSVMYWQQLIITLKKSGGVHTFKTTDLHNNSLSLGHDYKSILAIINHASIRENKNCKLAPAMYA